MMKKKEYTSLLISDFTINDFSNYLNVNKDFPAVKSYTAPFNQVMQVLMDKKMDCWKKNPDIAVIWTTPEIIRSFGKLINYDKVTLKDILDEVDDYSSRILNTAGKLKAVFVPAWILPSYDRRYSMYDMKNKTGISNTLMRMNLRLADNFEKAGNIHILNSQRWIDATGNAYDPKLWYMAKIPFKHKVFIEAVNDIKSAVNTIDGNPKKLIILDLDDTLWGGIVGDVGWKNIRLGGHDPIGEAFADFQKALKSLTSKGVVLGIVSKNEEQTALKAISSHPEMILRPDDFVSWKINWKDKAENINEMVSELNLGLQSVVFIDDSSVERARVREALPEVFVPEWPEDKMLYKKFLLNLDCFDASIVSKEDYDRTKMYLSEKKRRESQIKIGSFDEWLKSVNIKVEVEKLSEIDLERTVQLLNKTNQMNLTTRRVTEKKLLEWADRKNHRLWTFRVSDKFGDSGLAGVASIEIQGRTAKITDFVLSCRVMGRKIEEAMVYVITRFARSVKLKYVEAEYLPTEKNKPCLDFWKRSGFGQKGNTFIWDMNKNYPAPDNIRIKDMAANTGSV